MFNLNIPATQSLLGIDGIGLCSTPKTPEILNMLMNPMDNYAFGNATVQPSPLTYNSSNSANQQSISQDSSHSSCSGSPLDSPAGSNTTPSVQQTCSQLIKAGLKLSIQSKRKLSTCESSSGSELAPPSKCSRQCDDSSDNDCDNEKSIKGLTPEDEDRRKRRRERNKIAATKCRLKKRERTENLKSENDQLESQNAELKSQARNLQNEIQQLLEMLQAHSAECVRPGGFSLPAKLCQSPALKYLNELDQSANAVGIEHSQQPQQRTVIPPMSTIKYSRNGYKTSNDQLQSLQHVPLHHSDLLPNGYCKPSPTPQELGYLSSPSQEVSVSSCLQSMQTHPSQHQLVTTTGHLLSSDYIPNCDNSNNAITTTTLESATSEFVLKHELVDSQSPYTTAQSAERFLFESDAFEMKHKSNNNTIRHNNNNNIVDFQAQLATTPITTNCQSYDRISNLIKNDFETDLLAQFDGAEAEFTDLDTGVATAFSHMTNGGCLA